MKLNDRIEAMMTVTPIAPMSPKYLENLVPGLTI